MPRPRLLPLPAALLALLLAAPLAAQAPIPKTLPTGQRCEPSRPNPKSRGLDAVVDSLALTGALEAAAVLPAGAGVDFTLLRGESGALERVFVSRGQAADEVTRRVAELVLGTLRPAPKKLGPRDRTSSFRVVGGEAPALRRVSFAYLCAPKIANDEEMRRLLEGVYHRLAGRPEAKIVLQLISTPDGGVADVRVERRSGSTALVEPALEIAQQLRMHPGIVDGEPVAMVVHLPFNFVPTRPPR